MLQRLIELRELCVILSYIESNTNFYGDKHVDNSIFPDHNTLAHLGILPPKDTFIRPVLELTESERLQIAPVFWTNRAKAIDLVSFIDMLLALFQETDSYSGEEVLAFYEQREWRLVYHLRHGLEWYSLGLNQRIETSNKAGDAHAINRLRAAISQLRGEKGDENYFQSCKVLEHVDGQHISQLIDCVIVPKQHLKWAVDLLGHYELSTEVITAESLGYKEQLP